MEKTLKIENEEGLHARPAGVFVKKASEFRSQVFVKANETKVNAKSIMSLMTLGLEKNAEMTIITEGDDEKEALEALSALVEGKFAH